MSKLPSISGQECVKALEKIGFYQKRRESSHIIMRRDEPFAQVVVPDHQELAKGTLRAIIRDIDLSVEEFIALL
ncbi:type II toxin-antitoxin system HicA family toxin [Nostoc sp. FACHB-87]|uniref:type II toxin-antitoxin system HicA family toxin n=1 Tax=Nostocales TaxID=1161 RepID=UPI00168497A5|nr:MULTISPECIES: type II toxin-antitoxin system HicA family toxin [Nostocales]MBD2302543.1 type II toxin-antitoxin system HicA family toxin [Nostoc sp. FACHB-190]MBD2439105.1 type II toxin-antitoxin system HicA family toxin [Nostoc sp. FACHB-110]MBD2457160.1 type II toxin-antitoxin system HicA family toxin [Nostoc sp. FACHB-87]MBD2476974.1 type II toxin-antitoxin system HicA family toxin [Anabaena sp. FACHB-83]MBD2490570.1 type II toxin-antitoxin system HicA family toxin [Aulosira sp. FACHB-61